MVIVRIVRKKNIKYCVEIVNLVSWCLRKYFEAFNYSYFIFMLHLEKVWLQFYTSFILNYLHFFILLYDILKMKKLSVEENCWCWPGFVLLFFFLIFILFYILNKSSCEFIPISFTYISTILYSEDIYFFEKWITFCFQEESNILYFILQSLCSIPISYSSSVTILDNQFGFSIHYLLIPLLLYSINKYIYHSIYVPTTITQTIAIN